MERPELSEPQAPRPPLPARAVRHLAGRLRAAGARLVALAAWLWRHRPPARRAVALLFTLGIIALGILGAAFPWTLRASLPSPLEWAGAAALLARDARPGDAVAVSPPWAERIRTLVPADLPVLAQPRFAGEALAGVRRLWLVSLPEAPGFTWDAELDLVERAGRSTAPLQLGALQLTRYDLSFPDVPLAYLPDRLARAELTLDGQPCGADGTGGFRCAGGTAVSRSMREVDGVARPCLVVDGGTSGELALTFPGLPLGRSLRGHGGPAGPATPPRTPGGPAAQVAVAVDGEEMGRAELQPSGWRGFRVDTSRFAGGPHRLVLRVRVDQALPLCLDAVTLP